MIKKSNCRNCRRVGEKLFLKGDKCNTPACPFSRRSYAPGHLGAKRRTKRGSDYSVQLIEKQKARLVYGISEKQMAKYFVEARKDKAATGDKLLRILESRIDNIVFTLGWASSRDQARQIVLHGKVTVNGRACKIPSKLLKIGDKIASKVESPVIVKKEAPAWIKPAQDVKSAEIVAEPTIESILNINVQLIVEYYSR